jgi:outer membrane protein assembly factor BamC
MPAIFEKYGFKQTDLDESNQVYYVDYEKPDSGFWDSVWGKAKPMLNLENASYQFRLSTIGKHTAVVLSDKDNKPLSEDKINELFEVLAPAFLLK